MTMWGLVKAQSGLAQEVEGSPHHSVLAGGNCVLSRRPRKAFREIHVWEAVA